MSANETQVSGSHYKTKTIQPWDYIAANELGYFEGNVVKYVSRWRDKGGIDDLRKAQHYLEKLIELEEDELSTLIEHVVTREANRLQQTDEAPVSVSQ
jgi:hypothetical protein